MIVKHGLRASLTPIVTMFGMDFALLIGGAVITETVFNWQGLGSWVVSATFDSNLPVVVAVVVVGAISSSRFNLTSTSSTPSSTRGFATSERALERRLLEVNDLDRPLPDARRRRERGRQALVLGQRGETLGIVGESGSGRASPTSPSWV